MMEEIKVGDLVKINKGQPAWEYLNQKSKDYPTNHSGIVVERGEMFIMVNFGNYRAFLKRSDLLKVSEA